MNCLDLPALPSDEQVAPIKDCSWQSIVEAIRSKARRQPNDVARDLAAWADLLEGIAEVSGS